tara:strand:+ start:472 stop:852 length:381 start_codon:yes stop_codon:yes gene_type:complete
MRDKIIKVIEKHGLWFFCLWCMFLMLAMGLTSCDAVEKNQERNQRIENSWDNAENIDTKYYKCDGDERFLITFKMDDYKFIVYSNGYGSAMQAIPLNNNAEYIRMLEEENQLLGSKLAEIEIINQN